MPARSNLGLRHNRLISHVIIGWLLDGPAYALTLAMRSTIALATLVAFLTAPAAAKAQVAAGAHVDVVNGEIDPYLNVDPYGIATGILPGDQPRLESDTKTKVAIGLI